MIFIIIYFYRMLTKFIGFILKPIAYIFFHNLYEERIKIDNSLGAYDIWIHAASVGEFNAVKPLLSRLLEEFPNKKYLLTTMTKTGLEAAIKSNLNMKIRLFPLDIPSIMSKFYQIINPELIIIAETEFWPNMLFEAKKRKINVIIVNGRISDKSFKKYKYTNKFWKYFDNPGFHICTQSSLDEQRFKDLGFLRVKNCNNLKFNIKLSNFEEIELRKKFNYGNKDLIIVFGSSRPGEEKLIIDVFINLEKKIENLKLVIVPRHLNRIDEIKRMLTPIEYRLLSEKINDKNVLLVDKMGVLTKFYAFCNVAIVGGSFFDFGGHNPLEPAFYSKPIIIGNFHNSCKNSVDKLLDKNGIIISNNNELYNSLYTLLSSYEKRNNLGLNAKKVILENANSVNLHLEKISKILNEDE